jgi:methionyl-tRNA synthetase
MNKLDKYLVTTPIFYANGPPHIGHLYTILYANSYTKWLKINQYNVNFTTGTDEHGYKIYRAAKNNKIPTK